MDYIQSQACVLSPTWKSYKNKNGSILQPGAKEVSRTLQSCSALSMSSFQLMEQKKYTQHVFRKYVKSIFSFEPLQKSDPLASKLMKKCIANYLSSGLFSWSKRQYALSNGFALRKQYVAGVYFSLPSRE